MHDLRDQLADTATRRPARQPGCHPGRTHRARGLCPGCYEHHMRNGTLAGHPRIRRTVAEFAAAYTQLRAQGHSPRHVAYRLNLTFGGLNKAYYRAIAAGLITPDRRPA